MIELVGILVGIYAIIHIVSSVVSYHLLKRFFQRNDDDNIMDPAGIAKRVCLTGPLAILIWAVFRYQ